MLVGKRRRMLRYLERIDLERYRALVADLGLRAMIERRHAGSRLHPSRPGRRKGLARRLPRAARCCSSSTRSTSARSAAISSRSTRRSSPRSRPRASSWSGSASTASSRTRPSRRSSGSTSPCSPTSSPRARSRGPTASYLDGLGFANRTLVLIDEEGTVEWTYESPNPGEIPGANLIFDALAPRADT